jgi:hypothetical protein
MFHTVTAQGLFMCKQAKPDICPAIAYLTTLVTCSTESDWEKLVRLMKYFKQMVNDRLTLRADGELRWHGDVTFAVHPDFRSHTGAVMSMGHGAVISISRKRGLYIKLINQCVLLREDVG